MQPGRLIALAGRAHAGKNTLGNYLVSYGFKEFAFANQVKEDSLELINYFYRLYDQPTITRADLDRDKELHRPLLIHVGDVLGRGILTTFWVNILMDQIEPLLDVGAKIVITDMRYPEEVRAVQEMGGMAVRVTRNEAERRNSVFGGIRVKKPHLSDDEINALIDAHNLNPSECQIESLNVDREVQNTNLVDLEHTAFRMLYERWGEIR